MGKISVKKILLIPVLVLIVAISLFYLTFNRHYSINDQTAHAADWYDYDWNYRTAITIDNTKVDADLEDLPVLINSTNADWADTGHGGKVEQSDGGDFVFTDSTSVTKLSHEIEKYDNTTGQLVAWVKSDLANASDTIINLYFGNANCENQWDTNNVWTDYSHVWHLSEASWGGVSGEVKDSTSTARNGTASGGVSTTTGKIYRAGNFDGGDDFVNFGDYDDLTPGATVSFQAWVKTSSADNYDCVLCKWAADEYIFGAFGDMRMVFGFKLVGAGGWGTDYYNEKYSTGTISSGQWTRLTVTKTGTTLSFYLNGSASGTSTIANAAFLNGTASAHIGAQAASNRAFTGQIEDVRVVNSALPTGWISTEYNNQDSPGTFYDIGATEEGDTTPPTNPTTFNGYNTAAKTVSLTTGNWYSYSAPYFEFSGASDPESGVKGYYIYFGTTSDADPYTAGVYQAHVGIPGATQSYTVSAALTAGETYYLRLGTENNATNNNRSVAVTEFIYKYDNVAPAPPEYINVSPAGCSTSSTFTFTWPVGTDTGGSGVAGYDYKKGSTGTVSQTSELTILASAYQEGDNVFYVRSRDNAENISNWQTAIYCSTAIAQVIDGPTVTAGPSSITVNWVSNKTTTSYVKVYEGNTYVSEQGLTSYSLSHSVKVIGLEPEKNYRYQIVWTDASGNLGESDWYSTTTLTAPQINNLKADTLSPREINVSWNSTTVARFSIQYGIGDYSNTIALNDLMSGYSGKLSNMTPGKNYQLRINATSDDGTKFFAGQSFTMPPYPAASGLRFQPIASRPDTAITVSWTTNTETTSSVFYGHKGQPKLEISKSDKVKTHSIDVGNLADNFEYEIYVTGIDQFGNVAKSETNIYRTPIDTRAPAITDVSSESSNVGSGKEDSAQIAVGYKTDEPAKCWIEYAPGISGESYSGKTPDDSSMTDNHITIIPDLKPQTPYHFKVVCFDKANNRSESFDQTVVSGAVNLSVFSVILRTLNNLFGWLKIL